jgi:hypothetical protein
MDLQTKPLKHGMNKIWFCKSLLLLIQHTCVLNIEKEKSENNQSPVSHSKMNQNGSTDFLNSLKGIAQR